MNLKNMQILHVLSNVSASGAERMLESIKECEQGLYCNQYIFAFGSDYGFVENLESAGFSVTCADGSAKEIKRLAQFARVVFQYKPKVLHLHIEQNFLVLFLLCKFFAPSAKLIRTVHGHHTYKGTLRIRRIAWTVFATKFLKVNWIAVSDRVLLNERSYKAFQVSIIDNWISGDMKINNELFLKSDLLPRNTRKRRILLLGNCDLNKNHIEILDRFSKDDDVEVLHLGSTLHADEQEISALGNSNVRLLASSSKEAIDLADELVMPSWEEASPLVVLESLARLKPIHVRRTWGDYYSKWCAVTESEIGSEYMKLVRPVNYQEFVTYFSPERGLLDYAGVYFN